MEQGKIKPGIRISKDYVTFNFEILEPLKTEGKTTGLDIGMKKVFSTSDNQVSPKDKDGWNLDKILMKMSRKKKGSKGFEKCQEHRNNYINWSLNQLNLKDTKILKLENIKDLRRFNNVSRKLSHWTYTDINRKLESLCDESGVQIHRISPIYTSQRCSKCGWVKKTNRSGERFKCKSCGFTHDSDLNAAINISLDLPEIGLEEILKRKNRKGFYWNVLGEEPIVPRTQETDFHIFHGNK
jgi:IS605 OrfB family transposase